MTLDELALGVQWTFGLLLEEDALKTQALNAARHFAAWGRFEHADPGIDALAAVSGALEVTASEWGLIKPLYMLYVERENARGLEASRGQGVDPYGRDVNTIEGDIRQYETVDLPRLAFDEPAETI